MDAQVNLTGWVGGPVESRPTRNGTASASFRLGSTPRIRRNGEWVDGETTWLTVTCFRSLAENVATSLGKGDPVVVAGKLRTQSWTKDGERHERLVLEAVTIGHDLTKGTSAFSRSERTASDDPSDLAAEVGELIASVESTARDGERPAA